VDQHPLVVAVLAAVPTREARFSEMRAYDEGVRAAAKVVENALVNKSFGWVIRRAYHEQGRRKYQYLSQVIIGDEGVEMTFGWANSRHNSELFDTEFKDAIIARLTAQSWDVEAVELFTT
jgi:hypothetical protein